MVVSELLSLAYIATNIFQILAICRRSSSSEVIPLGSTIPNAISWKYLTLSHCSQKSPSLNGIVEKAEEEIQYTLVASLACTYLLLLPSFPLTLYPR
jgi:hypothetical protein